MHMYGALYYVRRGEEGKLADKPDSVPDRGRAAVIHLGPASPPASCGLPGAQRATSTHLLGLAPDGVYLAVDVAVGAGALLPHRFTLAGVSSAWGAR